MVLICHSNAVADREMVFWLLARGGDLNVRAHTDITPLSVAVRDAALDLLEELLNHSGDVQKGEVLQYALDRKKDVIPVIGMLLDRGAPLDAVMYEEHPGSVQLSFMYERHTPLGKAAETGNAEAVRFLLERGADPSVQSSKGRTALECAEQKGHREIVEILSQWKFRSSGAGKQLPKTRFLLERQEIWVKTENLTHDGKAVKVGEGEWWADLPRDPPPPALSGGGVSSQQAPQGRYGNTSSPGSGVEAAEITISGRIAEWLEQSKEVVPFGEDSFSSSDSDESPGCFNWTGRWRRWRRRLMRRKEGIYIDD